MTKQDMRALGAKGGKTTAAKHGSAYMSEIGKAGFTRTSEKMGGPYQVVKMLQQRGDWKYIEGKKIGGDHYDAFHAKGSNEHGSKSNE